MEIDILSLFPEYFESPFEASIIGRARKNGHVTINLVDIRSFSKERHKKVDDRPFGGGPGMVLCPEPVVEAIRSRKKKDSKVVFLSPQGKTLTAKKCEELSLCPHLILLCGHYEGIDERAMKEVDEEISIGDYVLTNGCIAAIVLVDATLRFIPGVLGDEMSSKEDSFNNLGILDAPQYTRPVEFEGEMVPEILVSGNHAKIASWRYQKSLNKTEKVRPDLYEQHVLRKENNCEQKCNYKGI